jgi:hypothetical protein
MMPLWLASMALKRMMVRSDGLELGMDVQRLSTRSTLLYLE